MRWLVLACCLVGGCALPDSSYNLDGVQVILEHSKGPEHAHLAYAVGVYRDASLDHWMIGTDIEEMLWTSLEELRWTDMPMEDGVEYVADVPSIRANWRGCALSVPLWWAMTEHYTDEFTEADQEWLEGLIDRWGDAVCAREARNVSVPW